MSSPTILTAVTAPAAEAYASNVDSVRNYLDLARALWDQGVRLQQEIVSMGGRADYSPPTPEQASARANALLNSGNTGGYEGVEYAHAYWQSLKHPWHEQALRSVSEARAGRKERRREESARLAEIAKRAEAVLGVHVAPDRLTVTAPGRPDEWSAKIAAALEATLQVADAESYTALRETIEASAHMDPRERFLAIDALRIRVGQETKQRRQQEALRVYETAQAALTAERVEIQLRRVATRVENMEAESAVQLETERAEIVAKLASGPATRELEERACALEQRVIQENRRQGLVEAAVAALRQQGYETVQIMRTIGPPDIASVYMQDPRDENRLALLQVAEERGTLAAEVIRREDSNGSRREKQLDQEAQGRLCKAVEAMEAALSEKWKCSQVKRVEPGAAEPKVRKDLPGRAKRMRVAGGLKTALAARRSG